MDDNIKDVKSLITKAAKQDQAHFAMQFAQAALNAAHAIHVIASVPEKPPAK